MVEALENLWRSILDVTSLFVIPDWGSIIGLIPILLVVGALGPILSLMALAWFVYVIRRPRVKGVTFSEGPRPATLDDGGRPIFPSGDPYCLRDHLVYEFGTTTCDGCGDDLLVACPKCQVTRPAFRDTCANCGLVLRVEPRMRALRRAGPPPGGAALA